MILKEFANFNGETVTSTHQSPGSPHIKMRPYQKNCLAQIKELKSQGKNRQLVSLPTGSGKTVIFAQLIKELKSKALIIAHTHELLRQAKEKLNMIAPELEVGFVDGERKEFKSDVVIASVQSARLDDNLEQLAEQDFRILIFDECHHAATDGARKILDRLGFGKNTDKLLVGFTATAFRQDSKGLGEVFEIVSFEKEITEMIEEGWLVSPTGFKVATDLDLSRVKSVDGDFVQSSLAKIMDTPDMNRLVVESYHWRALGKKAICFGVNVSHAKNLAAGFMARGIVSQAISGETPLHEREQAITDFKSGKITVLTNCQVLTEGVDLPETECVIVARPTRSKGLFIQMVGRGLRPWPNKKECIVLDFNDRSHTICNTALLLSDFGEKNAVKESSKQKTHNLPARLNPKLKAAIVSHDPLGQSFVWERDENQNFTMRGSGTARILIVSNGQEHYTVLFKDEQNWHKIAENLLFEWAFSTAEDFAKANRRLFVLSDKEAEWRKLPISEGQIRAFKKFGFKAGIEKLTRGQASDLMQSGVLLRSHR